MLVKGKAESQANLSTQKKVAIARKEPDKFYFISGEEKRVSTKSRLGAHPEPEVIAREEVISRWESGNPATSPELYRLLRTKFDSETEFYHSILRTRSKHL